MGVGRIQMNPVEWKLFAPDERSRFLRGLPMCSGKRQDRRRCSQPLTPIYPHRISPLIATPNTLSYSAENYNVPCTPT